MARRRTSAPLVRAVASRSIAAETAATRSGHCASSEEDAGCIPTRNHGPTHRLAPKVRAYGAVLRTVVEFRRRTLLPLDDVLGCLRDTIPKLTRSALHRCLVRHGISRLPRGEEK